MATTRVTITLPPDVVDEIDRIERNRSRFVLEAVRREIRRRREEELRRSLENPHPESGEYESLGLEDWSAGLSRSDLDGLLVRESARPIRWVAGEGWKGEEE